MKKRFLCVLLLLSCFAFAAFAKGNETDEEQAVENVQSSDSAKYLAAAIAVGLACLAGGIAVGKIGTAAMGAMSENPELSGKALPFVGLAEGICLWGMLVGVLILL